MGTDFQKKLCFRGKISSACRASSVQSTAPALQISMCFVKPESLVRDSGTRGLLEQPVVGDSSY